MSPAFPNTKSNDEMVQIVSNILMREVIHHKEMTDKFNKWKYGKIHMNIESEEYFTDMLQSIEKRIENNINSLHLYKKYAKNN